MNHMKEMARQARDWAYAPYSEFQVGACIKTENGLFAGANQEFAGRMGIHAEEMACGKAKMADSDDFKAIAVSCIDEKGRVPCGKCLTVIGEFVEDINIYTDCGNEWEKTSLNKELPNAYRRGGGNSYHE